MKPKSTYRQAAENKNLKEPSVHPVWWLFKYEEAIDGNVQVSYCHVFTRLWIDALAIAQTELGTPEPYLYPEDYDKRSGQLA